MQVYQNFRQASGLSNLCSASNKMRTDFRACREKKQQKVFEHCGIFTQESEVFDEDTSSTIDPSDGRFQSVAQNREDQRYVLDDKVQIGANLGTYIEGQNLLKPRRPRGPESFPWR